MSSIQSLVVPVTVTWAVPAELSFTEKNILPDTRARRKLKRKIMIRLPEQVRQ